MTGTRADYKPVEQKEPRNKSMDLFPADGGGAVLGFKLRASALLGRRTLLPPEPSALAS
jgi:hypothetical protein